MKKEIHPDYHFIEVTMTDGKKYVTRSTLPSNAQLVIDPLNHPAYTGKRRQVDSEGRIDKFNKRFGRSAAPATAE
jgi:large subunit ribosomal protein L31